MALPTFTAKPKFHITPEVLAKVEELAAKDFTENEVAAGIGIHPVTYSLKKKDEKNGLIQAYERGKQKALAEQAEKILEVKKALFKNATTMALDKDGNEVGNQGGDTKAQMFILKAKAGWIDTKVDIGSDPDRPILIAPLFNKDYTKSLGEFLEA
jgi:hypothetical protein